MILSGDITRLQNTGKLKIKATLTSSFLFSNITMDTRMEENVFSITGGIFYKLAKKKIKSIKFSSKFLKLFDNGKIRKRLQLNIDVS